MSFCARPTASLATLFPLILLAVTDIPASSAHGYFVKFELVDKTAAVGGDPKLVVVFELYAEFDSPLDNVVATFGAVAVASANFIHNPADQSASSFPLTQAQYMRTGNEVDSFLTLGFAYSSGPGNPDGPDEGTGPDSLKALFDPGFCAALFQTGAELDDCNAEIKGGAGWFTFDPTNNNIQGIAGSWPELKVRLGRFAVPVDERGCATITFGKFHIIYKQEGGQIAQTGNLEEPISATLCGGEPPTGACCDFFGDCQDGLTEAECEVNPLYTWQGPGTTCAGAPCSVLVADCCCCEPEPFCLSEILVEDCVSVGGTPVGLGNCQHGVACERDNPADINNDGVVDGADLGLLLGAWGTSNPGADLDDSGVVDGADLGLLLGTWTG